MWWFSSYIYFMMKIKMEPFRVDHLERLQNRNVEWKCPKTDETHDACSEQILTHQVKWWVRPHQVNVYKLMYLSCIYKLLNCTKKVKNMKKASYFCFRTKDIFLLPGLLAILPFKMSWKCPVIAWNIQYICQTDI